MPNWPEALALHQRFHPTEREGSDWPHAHVHVEDVAEVSDIQVWHIFQFFFINFKKDTSIFFETSWNPNPKSAYRGVNFGITRGAQAAPEPTEAGGIPSLLKRTLNGHKYV